MASAIPSKEYSALESQVYSEKPTQKGRHIVLNLKRFEMVKKMAKFGQGSKINPHHFGFWGLGFGAISILLVYLSFYWLIELLVLPAVIFAGLALILGIKGLKKGRKNKWVAILSILSAIPAIFLGGLYVGLFFFYVLNH
jgi:hypothetical protein